MPEEISNPFPLQISTKEDSWEKLQLLINIDPTLKLTAEEQNIIKQALNYLYYNVNGGDDSVLANIPANFKPITIDFNSSQSTHTKVLAAINLLPNYVLNQGIFYLFYTSRIVLSNPTTIGRIPIGVNNYAVITEYYSLTKKIEPNGSGIASVGVGGTPLGLNDIRYFNKIDTRSYTPTEFDLGDIGTDDIHVAVNTTGPYATPFQATILFRAIQDGIERVWLYLGHQEEIGIGYALSSITDYRLFPDEDNVDPPPPYQETLPELTKSVAGKIPLTNHEGKEDKLTWSSELLYIATQETLYGKYRKRINAPSQPKVRTENIVLATALVVGKQYTIKTVGTTDFTLYGASANVVGTVFTCTVVGTGTGDTYKQAIQIGGNAFVANTNMYLHFLKGGEDVEYKFESLAPNAPTVTPNTGTTIDLSNPFGDLKNNIANNATSYTIGATVVAGGFEERLINAPSEPSVTGATGPITGSDFEADTDMYMVTWNNGTRSEFHFQAI